MSILTAIKSRITPGSAQSLGLWTGAAAFSVIHVIAMWAAFILPSPEVVGWLFPVVTVLPGLISMTLLPGGWKRWYRWAAILGLTLNAVDPFIIVLIGETWALHRMWVTERTVPIKTLFRRGKPQEPVSAPKAKASGSRRPKTA